MKVPTVVCAYPGRGREAKETQFLSFFVYQAPPGLGMLRFAEQPRGPHRRALSKQQRKYVLTFSP